MRRAGSDDQQLRLFPISIQEADQHRKWQLLSNVMVHGQLSGQWSRDLAPISFLTISKGKIGGVFVYF